MKTQHTDPFAPIFIESSLSVPWPNHAKAAVSLSFDDAWPSQIDIGLQILAEYDIRGTFYILPALCSKRLRGWGRAIRLGHELGNHTFSHPCSGNMPFARQNALESYTVEKMENEIDLANIYIYDNYGVLPKSFAYPCGQTFVGRGADTVSYVPVVSERFVVGRLYLDEIHNNPHFCDLALTCGSGIDGKSAEEVIQMIEAAVCDKGWIVLCGHKIGERTLEETTGRETLTAVCRHLRVRRNEIWTAPVAEVGEFLRSWQVGISEGRGQ